MWHHKSLILVINLSHDFSSSLRGFYYKRMSFLFVFVFRFSTFNILRTIQFYLQIVTMYSDFPFDDYVSNSFKPPIALNLSLAMQKLEQNLRDPSHGCYPPINMIGSWYNTILKELFYETNFVITPKFRDTEPAPDFLVEEVIQKEGSQSIVMETRLVISITTASTFEKALTKLSKNLLSVFNASGAEHFSTYAIVTHRETTGFFEFHSNIKMLDEKKIPHFKGFVSLLQSYFIRRPHGIGDDYVFMERVEVDPVMSVNHSVRDPRRADGWYDNRHQCLFNGRYHLKEIWNLLNYIPFNLPRPIE